MNRRLRDEEACRPFGAALLRECAVLTAGQKSGGILRQYMVDSPASMSIHEEATVVSTRPMMAVFNNLVLYDQHVKQNRPDTIVPALATVWSWSEDGTELTFPLRQGVKWHDGKPFTAKDVKCTWDMLVGKASDKLRVNPRKSWYRNLEGVTVSGDHSVTFHLKRPQPSFLALLAGGLSPSACHVSPRHAARQSARVRSICRIKPNEHIMARPDY